MSGRQLGMSLALAEVARAVNAARRLVEREAEEGLADREHRKSLRVARAVLNLVNARLGFPSAESFAKRPTQGPCGPGSTRRSAGTTWSSKSGPQSGGTADAEGAQGGALRAVTSTGEQNPAMQVEELRRVAEQRGWEVVGVFVDQGFSGAKDRQLELGRMMGAACWKPNRLQFGIPASDTVQAAEVLCEH